MAKELTLPPYPAQAQPGDYIWVDWWRQLQQFMRDILKQIEEMQYVSKANEMFGSNVEVVAEDDQTFSGGVAEGALVVSQGICVFSFQSTFVDTTTDVSMAPNPVSTTWTMTLKRASPLPQPFLSGVPCEVQVVVVGTISGNRVWRGQGVIYGTGTQLQIQADVGPLMRSTATLMTVNGSFPVFGI